MRNSKRLVLLASLIVWLGSTASAQTGTLTGRVTDDSGAVIPGAKVEIKGAIGLTIISGNDGSYSFARLPAGAYILTASAPNLITPQPITISVRAGAQTWISFSRSPPRRSTLRCRIAPGPP